MTLQPRVFSDVAIPVSSEELVPGRQADVVIEGLEQAGDSYILRVFVNDPEADADTDPAQHPGYAGSIHVYGYGGMLPGEEQGQAAPRMPTTRRQIATQAIRAAAAEGSRMTVTLVPVAYRGPEPDVPLEHVRVYVAVHE